MAADGTCDCELLKARRVCDNGRTRRFWGILRWKEEGRVFFGESLKGGAGKDGDGATGACTQKMEVGGISKTFEKLQKNRMRPR